MVFLLAPRCWQSAPRNMRVVCITRRRWRKAMADDEITNPDRRDNTRVGTDIEVDLGSYSRYQLQRSANISNVSAGGVFIRTRDPQPVGTILHIRFLLPGEKNPVQCSAQVRWVYHQPASVSLNSSGMGLQF